jgi:hypothetical protein
MGDAFLDQGAILQELPLHQLFSAPLHAAAKAQAGMAVNTALFLQQFGLDSNGQVLMTTLSSSYDIPKGDSTDLSGDYLKDPRTINAVNGQRVFGADDGIGPDDPVYSTLREPGTKYIWGGEGRQELIGFEKQIGNIRYLIGMDSKVKQVQGIRTISVPFITLVNVPSLAMNLVTIDFTISIKTQSAVSTSTTNAPVTTTDQNVVDNVPFTSNDTPFWQGGGSAGFGRKTITTTTGTLASTEVAKSETTTTSTYQVSLKAKQKQPPGMKILLDFVTRNKDAAPKRTIGADGQVAQDTSVQGIRRISGSSITE